MVRWDASGWEPYIRLGSEVWLCRGQEHNEVDPKSRIYLLSDGFGFPCFIVSIHNGNDSSDLLHKVVKQRLHTCDKKANDYTCSIQWKGKVAAYSNDNPKFTKGLLISTRGNKAWHFAIIIKHVFIHHLTTSSSQQSGKVSRGFEINHSHFT